MFVKWRPCGLLVKMEQIGLQTINRAHVAARYVSSFKFMQYVQYCADAKFYVNFDERELLFYWFRRLKQPAVTYSLFKLKTELFRQAFYHWLLTFYRHSWLTLYCCTLTSCVCTVLLLYQEVADGENDRSSLPRLSSPPLSVHCARCARERLWDDSAVLAVGVRPQRPLLCDSCHQRRSCRVAVDCCNVHGASPCCSHLCSCCTPHVHTGPGVYYGTAGMQSSSFHSELSASALPLLALELGRKYYWTIVSGDSQQYRTLSLSPIVRLIVFADSWPICDRWVWPWHSVTQLVHNSNKQHCFCELGRTRLWVARCDTASDST